MRTKVSTTLTKQAGIPTDTSAVPFDAEPWLTQAPDYPESTNWWEADREDFLARSTSGHPKFFMTSID